MGRCEQNTFCITFRSFLFNLGVLSTSWSVTPSLCHIPRPRVPVMIDVSLRPATPLLHVHPPRYKQGAGREQHGLSRFISDVQGFFSLLRNFTFSIKLGTSQLLFGLTKFPVNSCTLSHY